VFVPIPLPCTVTLADPVDTKLHLLPTLNEAAANERDSVMLPTLSPTEMLVFLDPIVPWVILHEHDESEIHWLVSDWVIPFQIIGLSVSVPKPRPVTVKVAAPDVAKLYVQYSNRLATSNVKICDALPKTTKSTEIEILELRLRPYFALQYITVSEIHSVSNAEVSPRRLNGLMS
jgi:hypothetical protein